MAYDRCSCCNGKKTIIGLGGMIKECKECNGVGHVKPVEVVVEKKKRKPRVTSKEE